MIEFDNVTKIYRSSAVAALKNISFEIKKGEFVFVVGSSGAGKSTLTKLMLREELPDEGEIQVGVYNVRRIQKRKIPKLRRSIGMVFQDFRLLPNMTVFENVAFAMEIVGATGRQIKRRVPEVLSMLGLEGKTKCRPAQLSGGEQQRVSLGRAIVNDPKIIIADEPTGNLDFETASEIMSCLDHINKTGTTVLVVTHARDFVNSMKKRVLALKNGELVRDEKEGRYKNEAFEKINLENFALEKINEGED